MRFISFNCTNFSIFFKIKIMFETKQLDVDNALNTSFFVFNFIFVTLKIIFKIFDSIDFFKWNRDIKNCFKWARFWKYIQIAHSANNESNNFCCIAFKQIMKKGLYHNIENLTIIKNVWNKIVEICEFIDFSAFMIIYYK